MLTSKPQLKEQIDNFKTPIYSFNNFFPNQPMEYTNSTINIQCMKQSIKTIE